MRLYEYSAWYAEAQQEGRLPDSMPPVEEAEVGLQLAFERARKAGGDFTDPTPELVRAVLGDRDDTFDVILDAVLCYFLYLRADGLWRRSERNVKLCFDAVDEVADDIENGRTSYGSLIDDALTEALAAPPPSAEVQAQALATRRFATAVGPFLDRVYVQQPVDDSVAAEALGLESESRVAAHWLRALVEHKLIAQFDTRTFPGPLAGSWPDLDDDARLRSVEAIVSTMLTGLALEVVEPRADLDAEDAAAAFALALVTAVAAERLGRIPLTHLVDIGQDGVSDAERGAVTQLVSSLIEDLAAIGLVSFEDGVVGVPAEIFPLAAAAITSAMGWWPDGDGELSWAPVEHPSVLDDESTVVLRTSIDGLDTTWRRIAVPAGRSLADLHGLIQSAHAWWDSSRHVIRSAKGEHTAREYLRDFDREGEEQITSADAVAIGAVLVEPGHTVRYRYAPHPGAAWEVTVEVERVLPAGEEYDGPPVTGEGPAPYEYVFGVDAWQSLVHAIEDQAHPGHESAVALQERHRDEEARRFG